MAEIIVGTFSDSVADMSMSASYHGNNRAIVELLPEKRRPRNPQCPPRFIGEVITKRVPPLVPRNQRCQKPPAGADGDPECEVAKGQFPGGGVRAHIIPELLTNAKSSAFSSLKASD